MASSVITRQYHCIDDILEPDVGMVATVEIVREVDVCRICTLNTTHAHMEWNYLVHHLIL